MKQMSLMLTLLLATTGQLIAADKPNVIVIMADDIGFECYSAFGSEYYHTPHIDQLAKTGVKFTQAYSQPICTPTRTKIMTGQYNFQNYSHFGNLNLKQPTIGTVAKSAGYATAIAGKWQLSAGNLRGPNEVGFDEYCLWHFSGSGSDSKNLDEKFANKGPRFPICSVTDNSSKEPRASTVQILPPTFCVTSSNANKIILF